MKWAVFLDRDGVINEENGHISRPEDLKVYPGAGAVVKRLRDAGALVVVVTNQSAVARGLIDEKGLAVIHDKLKKTLAEQGSEPHAIYYCPHHPETHHSEPSDSKYRIDCDCRKPKPGLLKKAAADLSIDLSRSYMIGDTTRDMQTARNAGCKAVLVRTGYGGKDGAHEVRPDAECDDLAAAAEWVLSQAGVRS